jgi:glycosyltransferase involved in cell wall biosynthesis
MRIAVYHDAPPGGARRSLNEFCVRLAERHPLDLYRLDRGDDDPVLRQRANQVVTFAAPEPRPHRRLAAYWNDWLVYQDMQETARLEARIAARIEAGGYDVAFVSVQRSCQAPGVLGRLAHTPSLFFLQEPPLRRFFEPRCRPTAAPLTLFERGRYLWRWPTRALLDRVIYRRDVANARRATRLLANSRYTASRIEAVYGRDAAVNYYGVDTRRFRPPDQPSAAASVVSIGALEPHKGFDFVIRALGRIPIERRPSLTVVGITGHPRLPAALERLAAEAGVRLTIRRGVGRENDGSDDALVTLYQSHSLFVFGAHHEPISLVISEAMACGLPAVAVAEGGVPELVRDGVTGLLTARDEAAFAVAVDRLLADAEERRRMGQAARAAALEWTWDDSARRLEALLAETAASSRRPSERMR